MAARVQQDPGGSPALSGVTRFLQRPPEMLQAGEGCWRAHAGSLQLGLSRSQSVCALGRVFTGVSSAAPNSPLHLFFFGGLRHEAETQSNWTVWG